MPRAPIADADTSNSVPASSVKSGRRRAASVSNSIMNCQSRLESTTPAKFGSFSMSFCASAALILLPAMSSGALRTKNGMSTAEPI